MPLIHVTTTRTVGNEEQAALLSALSAAVSELSGKPEQYVMAILQSAGIVMAGTEGDAAFADIRSIGVLGPEMNAAIAKRVCDILKTELGVSGERIYLNFTDVARSDWGWDGRTFG